MQNITITKKGTKLVIEVDLAKKMGPSASGKSILIASTEGNAEVPGTDLRLGLNLYRPSKGNVGKVA